MNSQLLTNDSGLSKAKRLFNYGVFALILLVGLGACSSKEVNKDDPDALFSDAEESFKDERYVTALE